MCKSFEVDLRSWIAADLTDLTERFDRQIVGPVPTERWRESLADESSRRSTPTIAGMLLHCSYHHDLAVSTAVLDREPLMVEWRDRLGLASFAPEIGIAEAEAAEAVDALDLEALAAYFCAVLDHTHNWVAKVSSYAFDTVAPNTRRLEQRAGVRASEVPWFHAMWEAKPVSWLVRWEGVGHVYTHLGEMTALRNSLGLSPF